MNERQLSHPETHSSRSVPYPNSLSAIVRLCLLAAASEWLVWMQFQERAYDAFLIENQFCLLGVLLVLGEIRLEWRLGLVLLAYPYFQLLALLVDKDVPALFAGKQAVVLVIAVLLSLVMRLGILPLLGWKRIVPQFRLYHWMVCVAAAFVMVAVWRDDVAIFFDMGFIGRVKEDVLLQIGLSTWGAVAIALPLLCINSRRLLEACGLWAVIVITGVLAACWAYVTLPDWDQAPLNICVGNPVWSTIYMGVTLYVLNRAFGTFGVDLLQGQDT